jgi:ABC-type transport system involved in multi-copper enzyme maturation permease subunit
VGGGCHHAAEDISVQALILIVIYVLTLISTQALGFLISRLIDYQWPTLGLMSFLILFLAAFGIAWIPAVRITEWIIRSRGWMVETQQSGRAAV